MQQINVRATSNKAIDALRRKVIIDDAFLHIDKIPMTADERELLIKAELLCRKLIVNNRDYINSVITKDEQ
jgi:hypothetical protein